MHVPSLSWFCHFFFNLPVKRGCNIRQDIPSTSAEIKKGKRYAHQKSFFKVIIQIAICTRLQNRKNEVAYNTSMLSAKVMPCTLQICSCPFLQYFRTLFWDHITTICWWKLSKETSYWSKTGFFFSVKKGNNIFIPIIVILFQSNIGKYGAKGHE